MTYLRFVLTLTKCATPDRFIVLALVDTAFVDMAINLYESSLKPNKIDNFLFVGAGEKACEMLQNASLPCYHYTEDKVGVVLNPLVQRINNVINPLCGVFNNERIAAGKCLSVVLQDHQ